MIVFLSIPFVMAGSVIGLYLMGLSKTQSVLAASSTRFTPVLLTTLTTIGGLIPLTLYGGSLWQPLGIVLFSGLCVSAISSFLFVLVLNRLLLRN